MELDLREEEEDKEVDKEEEKGKKDVIVGCVDVDLVAVVIGVVVVSCVDD